MKTLLTMVLATVALSIFPVQPAFGDRERIVVINNSRMTPNQLMLLDRLNCEPIPDGIYVLNMNTGKWAYAANPYRIMGYIGEDCKNQGSGRHKSLSERGLLFSPGELLR